MTTIHNIGLLFSCSGQYSPLGKAMHAGAMLAISEVNANTRYPFELKPISMDAKSSIREYAYGAERLYKQEGVDHIIGCYTSSSRKEILPIVEKCNGLLWYPSHYEGFETSENVVYTGATPSQHIIPLLRFLIENVGKRAWCIGSNYIWAWENNRILREALSDCGGEVLGERYIPLADQDVITIAEKIVEDKPDFVFTTLVGQSLYSFLEQFRRICEKKGINQVQEIPVASCTLSESELPHTCFAPDGHISSSVYFSTLNTIENKRFCQYWSQCVKGAGIPSADAVTSYIAIKLLAEGILRVGTSSPMEVREAVKGCEIPSPMGNVRVDPDNLHCFLIPRIGKSCSDGTFEILYQEKYPVSPDPYLSLNTYNFSLYKNNKTTLRLVQ